MGRIFADRCEKCGKTVVKHSHADSSDMVQTNDSFLYLCDVKEGESSRPSLYLREYASPSPEHHYCLDCLLVKVAEWIAEMKKRGASKIPLDRILLPKGEISSPCPVCGR